MSNLISRGIRPLTSLLGWERCLGDSAPMSEWVIKPRDTLARNAVVVKAL
jgi:hypothetical protein